MRLLDDLRVAGSREADRTAEFLASLPAPAAVWVPLLGQCADPDLAAVQLVRLHESAPDLLPALLAELPDCGAAEQTERAGAGEHPGTPAPSLYEASSEGEEASEAEKTTNRLLRLVRVLGGSRWCGDYLIAHPTSVDALWTTYSHPREELLNAVGAHEGVAAPWAHPDHLRARYRTLLLAIAADDLNADDSLSLFPQIAARLSDCADAAVEAALSIARRDHDPDQRITFCVIAMGKTGARELNYISDVDVLYVAESRDPEMSELDVIAVGTALATSLSAACSATGGNERPLWNIDANLRPEGRDGSLVRTLASYEAYWKRWAQTWEFQALMKARCCAGDRDLGRRFDECAASYVWEASAREGFVENARSMRIQVDHSVPRHERDRELKLGSGGLRDVEFTVQLLQLVHGRHDSTLREASTLDALDALSAGGYIARSDAAELAQCYAFLRTLEHRAQLTRMTRTHLLPAKENDLRALARSLRRPELAGVQQLSDELRSRRQRVKELHEAIFYRPIVGATARLSGDDITLNRQGAEARLSAIGYLNPHGALTHIEALTRGVSRRATIQKHLLPVLISWFSQGADPDMGLLGFRNLSETIGDSHWYLALLRDSGQAAQRLCHMLSNSRWIADLIEYHPEAVAWLDRGDLTQMPDPQRIRTQMVSLAQRCEDEASAAQRIRTVYTREMIRAVLGDIDRSIEAVNPAISTLADLSLNALCTTYDRLAPPEETGGTYAVIAMGRYGGQEMSYASDCDVMSVYRCADDADSSAYAERFTAQTSGMKNLLSAPARSLGISLDYGLRPEGKTGAITRNLDSYRAYYSRWSHVWERQALLRARPAAGDPALLDDMMELINRVRYGQGLSEEDAREIRLLKARMEHERLPRSVDPHTHVKLGRGGLSDVEWCVQLLQLRHAHEELSLRTPSTPRALSALAQCGILSPSDEATLRESWELASRIRAGNAVASGRLSGRHLDVLPSNIHELSLLAHLLGMGENPRHLREEWLRVSRRARDVMERIFWN